MNRVLMKLLITGGAGFIGSNFIYYQLKNHPKDEFICLDALTYAGNLETLQPAMQHGNLKFVKDRPGHDRRYAIDPAKIHKELGWLPQTSFAEGIKKTIKWYLANESWWQRIISGEYQDYYAKMYGNR